MNIFGAASLVPTGGWTLQHSSIMARNAYGVAAALEKADKNIKINLIGPRPSNMVMHPGPLPPTACHPTVDYLLNLGEDGPTCRFFWFGYELPRFPDIDKTYVNEVVPNASHLRRVVPE